MPMRRVFVDCRKPAPRSCLMVDSGPMYLCGQIDRIEVHEVTQKRIIFDYETGARPNNQTRRIGVKAHGSICNSFVPASRRKPSGAVVQDAYRPLIQRAQTVVTRQVVNENEATRRVAPVTWNVYALRRSQKLP